MSFNTFLQLAQTVILVMIAFLLESIWNKLNDS